MGRRSGNSGGSGNFDSFNDILTCLAGVMVLIIILVVIDAKNSKVLIPTPLEKPSEDLNPVFVEVNPRGEMMLVDVVGLQQKAQKELEEMANEAGGGGPALLQLLAQNQRAVSDDNYYVDLHAMLIGNTVLTPKPDAQGYEMPGTIEEITEDNADPTKQNGWYSKLLGKINKDKQYIHFLVRSSDPSYDAFRKARAAAWMADIKVAYEPFDNHEALKFGLGGSRTGIQ